MTISNTAHLFDEQVSTPLVQGAVVGGGFGTLGEHRVDDQGIGSRDVGGLLPGAAAEGGVGLNGAGADTRDKPAVTVSLTRQYTAVTSMS